METQNLSKQNMRQAVISVTHDLRSPLLTVKEIVNRYSDVMSQKDLEAIIKATTRATDICEETLSDMGLKAKQDNQCFAHQALWNLVTEYNARSERKTKVEFNCLLAAQAKVALSETALKRIVSNLIENSLRATNDNGVIRLTINEESEFIELIVVDNGHGISAEHLNKIGKYGVSFSKGGHGFGLWNIKNNLENMGGEMNIRSVENMGTEITLKIPKLKEVKATLNLSKYENFVLIDDDELIHDLMDFCLDSIGFSGPRYYLKNKDEFHNFMSKLDPQSLEETCFVMDANLGKNNPVGLELIKGYGITKQSVLFTGDQDFIDIGSLNLKVRCKTDSPFEFLRMYA